MQTTHQEAEQVQTFLQVLRGSVGDVLLGVYLHGSAVSCGLQPQSDIDLLAIVECELTQDQRDELLTALLRLSGRYPAVPGGPRCLEVMVVRRSDLSKAEFPVRAEFVYGEWLRDKFEAGERPIPERDPEYTLVIAQAREEAMPLLGPPMDDLLTEVPLEHVRQAMRDALPDLLNGLHGDERNVLLTLARMWHTASTGKFVTKDAAATWAIPRLSGRDANTLDQARRAYLGEVTDDWSSQKDAAQQLARCMGGHITRSL